MRVHKRKLKNATNNLNWEILREHGTSKTKRLISRDSNEGQDEAETMYTQGGD